MPKANFSELSTAFTSMALLLLQLEVLREPAIRREARGTGPLALILTPCHSEVIMTEAVIVSAVRTPIGTARKGTLSETSAEDLATFIIGAAINAAGIDGGDVDDVILGEAGYGGGDLARYAAVANGLQGVAGQAVNRHCASSLAAVGSAAASIIAGMEDVVIAGGVQASSAGPRTVFRVLGTEDEFETRMAPTFPHSFSGLERCPTRWSESR